MTLNKEHNGYDFYCYQNKCGTMVAQTSANRFITASIRYKNSDQLCEAAMETNTAFLNAVKEAKKYEGKMGEHMRVDTGISGFEAELTHKKVDSEYVLSLYSQKSLVFAKGKDMEKVRLAGQKTLNDLRANALLYKDELTKVNENNMLQAFKLERGNDNVQTRGKSKEPEEPVKKASKEKDATSVAHSVSVHIWGSPAGLIQGGNVAEVIVDFTGKTSQGTGYSGSLECKRAEAESKVRIIADAIDLNTERSDEADALECVKNLDEVFKATGCTTVSIEGGHTYNVEEYLELDVEIENSKVTSPDFSRMPGYSEDRMPPTEEQEEPERELNTYF